VPALIETIRVRHGVAPLWPLHLRRLRASSSALGLPLAGAFEAPSGAPDRVVRLQLDPGGLAASERPVGSRSPVRLITARTVHRPYPHKTTDREPFDRALAEARAAGADDALLLTAEGFVAECAIWSLFWWEGETLCAPSLDLGVLPGVGRARIAELAGGLAERRAGRDALLAASCFLANAVRGIVPVRSLDGQIVMPHGGTARLQERFWP
jgi:branched-subunit amino acid aminotransferase/4-amino-4-deoxychorismate lyase